VLNPLVISGDRNDDSLVLRLTCENVTVLLMGDATTASEESMLAEGL
jgi:beta-lactamase superfamily II metal-dependent hydrolase